MTDVVHEAALARAYRDGQVDAKIEQHQARLDAINGSVARTATSLAELVEGVHGLRADIDSLKTHHESIQPVIDQLMLDRVRALTAAETVADDAEKARKRWEGWRGKTAWTLGVIISVSVVLNLALKIAYIH